MQKPEDGSVSILNSIDGYANLLSVILSKQKNEEIQEELISLVGFENIELSMQLIEKRELIQQQCRDIEEKIKAEKNASGY